MACPDGRKGVKHASSTMQMENNNRSSALHSDAEIQSYTALKVATAGNVFMHSKVVFSIDFRRQIVAIQSYSTFSSINSRKRYHPTNAGNISISSFVRNVMRRSTFGRRERRIVFICCCIDWKCFVLPWDDWITQMLRALPQQRNKRTSAQESERTWNKCGHPKHLERHVIGHTSSCYGMVKPGVQSKMWKRERKHEGKYTLILSVHEFLCSLPTLIWAS